MRLRSTLSNHSNHRMMVMFRPLAADAVAVKKDPVAAVA
jgi:hypothetical protein